MLPTQDDDEEVYRLIAVEDELVLPPKYLYLKEAFKHVDLESRDLIRRNKMVVYSDIKYEIQKKTGRKFTQQHLAMIKAVYSDAFDLRYEVMRESPRSCALMEVIIDSSKSRSTNIYDRESIFHTLLLNKAKFAHHDFLQTLDPPIFVPFDEMFRWHPLFDLNSVPDIVPEPLADDVKSLLKKCVTEVADDYGGSNQGMEKSFLWPPKKPNPLSINFPYFYHKRNLVQALLAERRRRNRMIPAVPSN